METTACGNDQAMPRSVLHHSKTPLRRALEIGEAPCPALVVRRSQRFRRQAGMGQRQFGAFRHRSQLDRDEAALVKVRVPGERQANVPDYRVAIPAPDGSEETGPLSRIVNTHWNTLYWDSIRKLNSR